MWIIPMYVVSDELRDSLQEIENRFRSGDVMIQELLNKIYKQIEVIVNPYRVFRQVVISYGKKTKYQVKVIQLRYP